MKRCTSCQRTYPDDAPAYCVNDGTRLVEDDSAPAYDPQKTIMASAPPPIPPSQPYSNRAPLPNNSPPMPQPMPQQQAPWPPPPQAQGQNWGGGYYPQGQGGYAPPKSKGLSMATLIVGCISGVLGAFLLLDYLHVIRMLTRDTAIPMLIAAIATGGIALVLGIITLFSSRQRGKGLAAVGMILGAFSLGFWIYLEIEHGIFF